MRPTFPATSSHESFSHAFMLEVRGPNVFVGYWRMPEKPQEELLEDGFFVTGDLAMIDERGYVHIVGRDKDLVISGAITSIRRRSSRSSTSWMVKAASSAIGADEASKPPAAKASFRYGLGNAISCAACLRD